MSEKTALPILPHTAADLRRAGITIFLSGILLLVLGWRFFVGKDLGDQAGALTLWVVGGVLVLIGPTVFFTASKKGAPEPPPEVIGQDTTRTT